jgi:hypothetical protein
VVPQIQGQGAELTPQAPDGLLHPPRRHCRRPSDSFVVLGRADQLTLREMGRKGRRRQGVGGTTPPRSFTGP